MSKHEEKVIAEWPVGLRDEDQPLDPLPEGEQTDYVIIRFQGADTKKYSRLVKQAAMDVVRDHGDVVGVAFVTVTQTRNPHVPKNAWPLVRGIFDFIMNWSKR